MPAISPRDLVDAIVDAIEQSGYTAILLGSIRTHPRKLMITSGEGSSTQLWVYAWTLTFGGRESLPDEYRIQMTTVSSPLRMNPEGPTVLIGYEPDSEMFAGFDLSRHQTFTTGSPSVQVDINTVRNAMQYGLDFAHKSNQEIAVGIRPDQFVNYALNAEHLHRFGRQPDTLRLLTRAVEMQPITQAEIDALPEQRRMLVQVVSRLSRRASFRQMVLNAYANRCAVTRAQLKLVDAAHVLPVGAPESSDHVTNALALAPTYHRAYDMGLIYLDEKHVMKLNPAKVGELGHLSLDAGIEGFKAHLGKILLPQDRAQWPNPAFIRKANSYRLI